MIIIIIAVVETWVTDVLTDPELHIDGYEMYREDKPAEKGGGISFT